MQQSIAQLLSAAIVSMSPACFVLTGCATAPTPMVSSTPAPSLDLLYNDAIHRSAVVAPSDIARHPLLTVDRSRRMTTVVTWTTASTASQYHPLGKTTVGVDVWVTLTPQVRDICATFSTEPAALTLRLQQLLGLPPRPEQRVFVVMDVPTASLFRPCADPDPTKPACDWGFPPKETEKYKAWFADQVVGRYREAPDGYPWTRLGYTYDWAPGASGSGASEFVTRKGTPVIVRAKMPTADYCHTPQG